MSLTETKLDSQQVGLFLRALEHIEREVALLDYPDQPFADGLIVPTHTQNIPEAENFTVNWSS